MNMRLLFMSLLLMLAGCQTYQARPLAIEEYAKDWTVQDVDIQPVRDFAESLSIFESEPGSEPFDPSDGISRSEAEAVALHFNPQLRAVRARAQVPLASAKEAGWWPDPQFEAEILRFTDREGKHQGRDEAPRTIGSDGSVSRGSTGEIIEDPWIVGASLSLTIPISGRLAVEQDLRWSEYSAAWRSILVDEWQVLTQLRGAWIEWSTAKEQVSVTTESLKQLEAIGEIAERLVTAGEMKPTDARVLQIELARQQKALLVLEAVEQRGRLRILAVMGVSPEASIALDPETVVPDLPYPPEARKKQLIRTHPRIKAAEADYEAAEQRLRLEIQSQYPDLQIGPSFSFEEGFYRLGLGFGLPIPVWNRNRQGIAEAFEQREASRVAAEAALQGALSTLADLETLLANAAEQREFLESRVAPIVDQQIADSRTLLDLGEVNVLLLRDAVISALETKLDILTAILIEARAANELAQMLSPRWVTRAQDETNED